MEEEIKQLHKLYRSRSNRFLGGVCGGIAEYFHIDSNMTRLLFVIGTFLWGIGIILYLAALILVPEDPDETAEPQQGVSGNTLFWGILFIALGAILLSYELDLFSFFHIVDLPWPTIWGLFLIAIGALILFAQWKKKSEAENSEGNPAGDAENKSRGFGDLKVNIHRSRADRKIAGVCGGLAVYFNIDSTIIRLAWILLTIASKGLGILIYIIFIFVFSEEDSPRQTV